MKKSKRSLIALFLIICLFTMSISINASCPVCTYGNHVKCVSLRSFTGGEYLWIDFWGFLDNTGTLEPWRPMVNGQEMSDGVYDSAVGMTSLTATNTQAGGIIEVATSHEMVE